MDGNSGIVPTMPLGNNGFGGTDGAWIFALLILAFMGNGFGGRGAIPNVATTDFVSGQATQGYIFDTNNNINNGIRDINSNYFNGQARTNDNIYDLRATTMAGNMGLQNSVLENRFTNQLSAGQTQRDILGQTDEINTTLLTTALQNQAKMDSCCCSIKSQGIENTQKILDAISQNTIDNLREQVNDLKNTITANATTSNVINQVRPYPVPAYPVSSPYTGVGYVPSNWYGNTIV